MGERWVVILPAESSLDAREILAALRVDDYQNGRVARLKAKSSGNEDTAARPGSTPSADLPPGAGPEGPGIVASPPRSASVAEARKLVLSFVSPYCYGDKLDASLDALIAAARADAEAGIWRSARAAEWRAAEIDRVRAEERERCDQLAQRVVSLESELSIEREVVRGYVAKSDAQQERIAELEAEVSDHCSLESAIRAKPAPVQSAVGGQACTCPPGPARDAHEKACPIRIANPRTDLGDKPAADPYAMRREILRDLRAKVEYVYDDMPRIREVCEYMRSALEGELADSEAAPAAGEAKSAEKGSK